MRKACNFVCELSPEGQLVQMRGNSRSEDRNEQRHEVKEERIWHVLKIRAAAWVESRGHTGAREALHRDFEARHLYILQQATGS